MTLQTDLFKGNSIKLSVIRESDAEEMATWYDDSDYLRRVDTDIAFPLSAQTLRDKDISYEPGSNSFEFRIRTVEDDKLIGFVAIHNIEWNNQAGLLAIGIGNSNYRGKGLGTEALKLILQFAFHELNLNRVGLDVISYNIPAINAYQKVGFQVEGQLRNAVLRDGQAYHRVMMGILRNEWLANK